VNAEKPAGYYVAHWDGKDDQGSELGSGVYVYRIEAGEFVNLKKMLVLK